MKRRITFGKNEAGDESEECHKHKTMNQIKFKKLNQVRSMNKAKV